ncbi:MAG: N-acetyltransferase [Gammaproteobacteria bacterium]|nr:MAG: N-acetyltransferase [Gammaproteobacteria bacterium]
MKVTARNATEKDLPAIVEIYNQAIALGSVTADISPVTVESRKLWLQEHRADHYPVFVVVNLNAVVGWCSLSAYRPGRMALRHTAEISYYVDRDARGTGVGSFLISHAIERCPILGIKTLFAIILDINTESAQILEKFGFSKWGHLPNVANFNGRECGHLYYGLRVTP